VKQHLDTHVALWLAAGDKRRLKPVAKRLLTNHLLLSPMVIVETEVLREIGRLAEPAYRILQVLERHGVLRESEHFAEMLICTRGLEFTRGPFDSSPHMPSPTRQSYLLRTSSC
jgi:PIN domain nuclease of toxin-antitoxin system